LFGLKAFGGQWKTRQARILSLIGKRPRKADILKLGDSLSDIFKLTGSGSRTQASLSSAGTTWEALVVWYLNLCLYKTEAVCIRGSRLSPSPISDALSVCHESAILRSEPDVIVLCSSALANAPGESSMAKMKKSMDEIIEDNFDEVGLVNLQHKTNWNDNSQIPMLWNMLYNQARKGAVIPNGFSIGRNGFSLKNLGHFGYGFVTVPSQSGGPSSFQPSHLCVLRVRSMSAGNYWGYPTKSGVSYSMREFFNFFNKNPSVFPDTSTVGKGAVQAFNHSRTQLKYFGL
tara:strand:- start:14 stop:877 length:864 start_codon:yes stop_codon:yes gene_type:complete